MASKYPFPGVWTQRVERPQPAREISPSSMAIVGYTEKGPVNIATRINSWNEYQDQFGALTDSSYVPMSVMQFYQNGGQIAYVVRVLPPGSATASATIDTPTKWTVNHTSPGVYGNSVAVDIAGNIQYLNRTTFAWDRFDIYVLEPDADGVLVASEFFEAIDLADPTSASYLTRVLSDPERGSALVEFLVGAGGVPIELLSSTIVDEVLGTGAPLVTNFTGTLASYPVLDSTLRIVAAETQISNEQQTFPAGFEPNGTNTNFAFTLPNAPALDASVRIFYHGLPVVDDATSVQGLVNGANQSFTVAASALTGAIHRENTLFNIRYANTAEAQRSHANVPAGGAVQDLASAAVGGLTTAGWSVALNLPLHPGTVDITYLSAATPKHVLDDATTAVRVGSMWIGDLKEGATKIGEIDYLTGVIYGAGQATTGCTTRSIVDASSLTLDYSKTNTATKAPSANNLDLAVAFVAPNSGTVALVNSATAPTGNGAIALTTSVAPPAGPVYINYVIAGIVNSDSNGDLTGDVNVLATNTVDFVDGDANFTVTSALWAPITGSFIEADYYTGQVATDNGVGGLVGDVDPLGTNSIDYDTGAVDVTFAAAPPTGTSVLANYVNLEDRIRVTLTGGTDGTGVVTRNEVTAPSLDATGGGMYALKAVEDLFQLVIPDFAGVVQTSRDQLTFAEEIKRAFVVLTTPEGLTANEAKQWRTNDLGVFSRWGACYHPWMYVRDPNTKLSELYPPLGAICGVYARIDSAANVGASPAGTGADIRSSVGPEYKLGDEDLQKIFDSGMNSLRDSEATGYVVWGARTLERDNPDWLFINAQRLFNFLEYSAYRLTQFVVFGNNGPALWKRAELALTGWMTSLFNQGYFAGSTPAQAFHVICDASNNNQASIEEGIVYIDLGAAPFRPAEFVVVRIAQKIRQQA